MWYRYNIAHPPRGTLRGFDSSQRVRRPCSPVTDRSYKSLVPTSGVDRTPKIVCLLSGPVISMTQEQLGDANMTRIMDREFSGY
jgi:hypothetical protein